MSRHFLRAAIMIATLPLLLMTCQTVYAQGETTNGRLEFGIRQLYGERNSAKFTEYRDIPQGFFLRNADVELHDLFNKRFFFSFQARDIRENDQTFLVSLGSYRKYRLDLKWDQTPHIFTTTARSFLFEDKPGVFVAPEPVRSVLVGAGTAPATLVPALTSVLNSAPLWDMSLRRDKGAGTLTMTPTADWTLRFLYSREKMVGYRPIGTNTNSFTNIIELPEPINYRTHQLKTGAEYVSDRAGIQADYSASVFDNKVGELVWDVPFATTGTQGNKGRLDLYPSNNAQNLSFAGTVRMPHSTRVVASIVPGWMRQNDDFLPFTINPLLTVPALPAASLNGSKQTLAMNYRLTSKAIPKLPLTLRYTSYDYNNNTPSITFSARGSSDGGVSAGPWISEPFAYDRKNLDFNAAFEFMKNSSWKFLYNWERFNRHHRDAEQSTENTVGTSLDLTPLDWLLVRGSYKHGDRDPEEYVGVAVMLPSLRKFDQAGRTRHRGEALVELTPVDQISLTATYGTTQDAYRETGCVWAGSDNVPVDQCYGLLKDISSNYSLELAVNPTPQVTLFAEYTREKYNYRQLSRQRAPGNDTANNDWETNRRDLVDNYAAGLNASLSDKAIVDLFYSLSAAKNKIITRALGNTALTGFLVTTAVPFPGATDFPDTSNRWHQMVSSIKFPMKEGNLTPKLEYRYEKYDRVDFQLVNVGQYFGDPALATSLFLGVGDDIPGYNAHIVSASLEYRF